MYSQRVCKKTLENRLQEFACPRPSSSPNNGFTLIEILVVMIIIIIVTTVAVLAIGDAGRFRKARYQLDQLSYVLQYAEQYAILTPATLRFTARDHHYSFDTLSITKNTDGTFSHGWKPLPHTALANSTLSSDIQFSLSNPVIIDANGNLTPFSLITRVQHESHYFVLQGNAAGQITLTEKGASA